MWNRKFGVPRFFASFGLIAALLWLTASNGALWAQAAQAASGVNRSTLAQGVDYTTLANGLDVFAVENHSVPLATICIAFRGGASAQTPETAGLFHLYEHMLFAGNAKYPTKEAFNAALNRMGTTAWNGATGTEFINYYITVPSDKLAEGVDFWAQAVRHPLFDPTTLETEKQVVLNEIRGYHADPARIAVNALESRMFDEFPWRKNVDGPEKNVEGATVGMLRSMQSSFYIPSNMALFVGGDCTSKQVFDLAEKYFGDWVSAPAPVFGVPPQGPVPPGINLISVENQYYRGIAQVQFRWRGPDVLRQTEDTYVSDVTLFLLSSPVGRFKDDIMKKVGGLYSPDYIDFSYPTARDGGNYIFSAYMLAQKPSDEDPILDRVNALRAAVVDEFRQIAADPKAYFGEAELEKAKTKLIDQNIYAQESAETFVTDTLTFWWSTATADYFFNYENNCRKVSWDDVAGLIKKYLVGGGPPGRSETPSCASLVRIRTSTYDADPKMEDRVQGYGYTKVSADNAFWWQERGGAK